MLPLVPPLPACLAQSEVTVDGDNATAPAYFVNPLVLPQQDGPELPWEFGGYP